MKEQRFNAKPALAGLIGLAAYELIVPCYSVSLLMFFIGSQGAAGLTAGSVTIQLFSVLLAVCAILAAVKPWKAWAWVALGVELTLALCCLLLAPTLVRTLAVPEEVFAYGAAYLRNSGLVILIGWLIAMPCLFLRLMKKEMSLLIMVIIAGAAVLLSVACCMLFLITHFGVHGAAMCNLFHPMLLMLPALLYGASPFSNKIQA